MATPPPLYKNYISMGLIESFSIIVLLKVTPECPDGMSVNNFALLLQAVILIISDVNSGR